MCSGGWDKDDHRAWQRGGQLSLQTSLSISNTLCLHFIKDWCTGLQMGAVSAKQSPAALASLPAESMKNTSPDASNCQNREAETFVMPAFFWSKGSRSYQLELLNIGLMWWMPGMKQFTIETHWKRLILVYNWLLWVWQTHWKFKATIWVVLKSDVAKRNHFYCNNCIGACIQ